MRNAVLALLNKFRGLLPREGYWEPPRLRELSAKAVTRRKRGRPRTEARAKIEQVYRLAKSIRDGSFPQTAKSGGTALETLLRELKPHRGRPIHQFVELAAGFEVALPYFLSLPSLVDTIETASEHECERALHDTRVLILGYLVIKEAIYRRFGHLAQFPEDSIIAFATSVAIAARRQGFGPALNQLAEIFARHPRLNIWRYPKATGI